MRVHKMGSPPFPAVATVRLFGAMLTICIALSVPIHAAQARIDGASGYTRQDFQRFTRRYKEGALTSQAGLVRLAELTLAYDSPRHAAALLEKEIWEGRVQGTADNFRKLGDMWLLAREWEKAGTDFLAGESPPAQLEIKIAETEFEQQKWQRAEAHLRRAMAKGGLKTPCRARLLLGHTLSHRTLWPVALKEYERAAQSKGCLAEGLAWATYFVEAGQRDGAGADAGRHTPMQGRAGNKPTQRGPSDRAMKACRTGSFEVLEDRTADLKARLALIGAQEFTDPTASSPQRQRGLLQFEDFYLHVQGRLNAGALDWAREDFAYTEQARKQASETKTGEPPALARLLDVCADLHKRRIKMLKRAQRTIARAGKLVDQAEGKE